MVNIVTSLCIDTDEHGKEVSYPNLGPHLTSLERRETYWRCVVTFCLSSLRFNMDQKHYVFTNDTNKVIVNNCDIKELLSKLGVEIIEHPFTKYDPQNHSSRFRNAFYKLEVINLLGKLCFPSILLDADCLWTKRDELLLHILDSREFLLLQDTYQCKGDGKKKKHGLSMTDIAALYKTIPVNNFTRDLPVWYGGELVGGDPKLLKVIGDQLLLTINYCKEQNNLGNSIKFNNGFSIFDGDEFISSYVYNSLSNVNIYDTNGTFSKRLWTNSKVNNVKIADRYLPIWHLPAEKSTGLSNLFKVFARDPSALWKSKINIAEYLGSFVGIQF